MHPKHPWIARLTVGLAMLVLAFLGVVITDIRTTGGWVYWKWIVPVYALMALWLSWYLRKHEHSLSPVTIWHEALHWLGLIASALLVSYFVHMGILSRFLAGLVVLTLIAQAVFLAGVYIETSFLFIGAVLGIFALLVAFTIQYFYAFSIPVFLLGGLAVAWFTWHMHRKSKETQ